MRPFSTRYVASTRDIVDEKNRGARGGCTIKAAPARAENRESSSRYQSCAWVSATTELIRKSALAGSCPTSPCGLRRCLLLKWIYRGLSKYPERSSAAASVSFPKTRKVQYLLLLVNRQFAQLGNHRFLNGAHRSHAFMLSRDAIYMTRSPKLEICSRDSGR